MTDVDHPTIPWEQSADRTQMIIALRDGRIPLTTKDSENRRTTDLDLVWRTWCPNYSRKKLSRRLTALRKVVVGELQPNGFREPRKWENSAAYKLLEHDIRYGIVMRPEYALFDHQKFGKRLDALRQSAGRSATRASEDEKRFQAFASRHTVSPYSHKGYEQWQGSDAQKLLRVDMNQKKNCTMRMRDLYGSRPEYYNHFPLKPFRDFVHQEVRTGKWRHTLAVKGKQFKAS
jgi:hypothetical protein